MVREASNGGCLAATSVSIAISFHWLTTSADTIKGINKARVINQSLMTPPYENQDATSRNLFSVTGTRNSRNFFKRIYFRASVTISSYEYVYRMQRLWRDCRRRSCCT